MKIKPLNVQAYLDLPYNIILRHVIDDSGSYYFARVQEFNGCMSDGETIEEAYANIREAMEGWIETKLDAGFEVPIPLNVEDYSGKFVVRIPKSLHAQLVLDAEKEGVSLNQYALYKLAN